MKDPMKIYIPRNPKGEMTTQWYGSMIDDTNAVYVSNDEYNRVLEQVENLANEEYENNNFNEQIIDGLSDIADKVISDLALKTNQNEHLSLIVKSQAEQIESLAEKFRKLKAAHEMAVNAVRLGVPQDSEEGVG